MGLPVLAISKVDHPVRMLFSIGAYFGGGIEVKVFQLEESRLAVSAREE
jgi:hypothetical protein